MTDERFSVLERLTAKRERDRAIQDSRNGAIRSASGDVNMDNDPLVTFLYILMRDDVPPGRIEEVLMSHVMQHEPDEQVQFTNGWLARYAENIATLLRGDELAAVLRGEK